MKRLLLSLLLPAFLLACVPQGADAPDAALGISTDALATDAITAQPLDAAPAVQGGENQTESAVSGQDGGAPPLDADEPAALTDLADDPAPDPEPEIAPLPEPDSKPPSSPEEAACVKKGGLWIHAGKSIAFTCVKVTRDSGQQCRRSSDCQGSCLARSMTCAPYDPLFGCNEILQDDGVRVTLCID